MVSVPKFFQALIVDPDVGSVLQPAAIGVQGIDSALQSVICAEVERELTDAVNAGREDAHTLRIDAPEGIKAVGSLPLAAVSIRVNLRRVLHHRLVDLVSQLVHL